MTKPYKIFAVNPGSTSTKVAQFENEIQVFSLNAQLDAARVKAFPSIHDALPYYCETVLSAMAKEGIVPEGTDAFIGHTPLLEGYERGTYEVDDTLVRDYRMIQINHPVLLGLQIVRELASQYHTNGFVLYPHLNDFIPKARMCGLANVLKHSQIFL